MGEDSPKKFFGHKGSKKNPKPTLVKDFFGFYP
jgi:hypothetical protein